MKCLFNFGLTMCLYSYAACQRGGHGHFLLPASRGWPQPCCSWRQLWFLNPPSVSLCRPGPPWWPLPFRLPLAWNPVGRAKRVLPGSLKLSSQEIALRGAGWWPATHCVRGPKGRWFSITVPSVLRLVSLPPCPNVSTERESCLTGCRHLCTLVYLIVPPSLT